VAIDETCRTLSCHARCIVFRRFQLRRAERAVAYVDGTVERARLHDLTPLRVLEVVTSKRKGSEALVVHEDGQTAQAWFWWYQAKVGELVVCQEPAVRDGTLHIGDENRRGVVDRVPRDIMDTYRRAGSGTDGMHGDRPASDPLQ
jgi:hypothetical protein